MAGLEVLTVNKGLELSQPEQIPWNTVTLTPSGVDSLFVTKPDSCVPCSHCFAVGPARPTLEVEGARA